MNQIKNSQQDMLRYQALTGWVEQLFNTTIQMVPLTDDASFRCYYRIFSQQQSFVVMDVPPEYESPKPFIALSTAFRQRGLCTPEIIHTDEQRGFLIISDLGDGLYWRELNHDTADHLYSKAMIAMLEIQACQEVKNYKLPIYDRKRLWDEMNLFVIWYLQQYRKIRLTNSQIQEFYRIFDILIDAAMAQPQVCVHRDYHSRNLLLLPDQQIGILDFQDAVFGGASYDLASLLRDCYIDWPEQKIYQWVNEYIERASDVGVLEKQNIEQFHCWFDWMGLQRHLKCAGIFSRLYLRDNKPNYLQYIPRVNQYIENICDKYSQFHKVKQWLE